MKKKKKNSQPQTKFTGSYKKKSVFIFVVIDTPLFTLNCLYFFTLTYLCLCFVYTIYYMNLIKLWKHGEFGGTTKFYRLKSISSIQDNQPFTLQ